MRRALGSSLVAIAVFMVVESNAQSVAGPFGDPWLMGESAIQLPSLQGMGFRRMSVTVPHVEAWALTNAVSYGPLRDAVLRGRYTNALIRSAVENGSDRFFIGVGFQAQLLSLGFNINGADGRPFISIGIEHRERTMLALDIDHDLVDLLYNGNAQYAGQRLTLDPLEVHSIGYREIGINGAVDLTLSGEGDDRIALRPGLGLYTLSGQHGLHMNSASLDIYTHSDGRAIDFDPEYQLNTAIPDDGQGIWRGIGKGLAVDVSLGLSLGDRTRFIAGIDDLGAIRFNEGTKSYTAEGAYTYRGVQFTLIDQELETTVTVDSLVSLGRPEKTTDAWEMKLPTRVLLGGTHGVGRIDHEAFPLFRHTFGLMVGRDITRTRFSNARTAAVASYAYTINTIASFGATLSTRGDLAPGFGLNATVRAGPVRLGFGSNDLTGLLLQKKGTGAHAQVVLQVAW